MFATAPQIMAKWLHSYPSETCVKITLKDSSGDSNNASCMWKRDGCPLKPYIYQCTPKSLGTRMCGKRR